MHSNTNLTSPNSFVDYNAMERYVYATHWHYDKEEIHDHGSYMEKLENIGFWDSWKTMARRGRECGFDQLIADYLGCGPIFRLSKEKIIVGDIVHNKIYLYERERGLTEDISCRSVENSWDMLITALFACKKRYLSYREEYTPEEKAYWDAQYLL